MSAPFHADLRLANFHACSATSSNSTSALPYCDFAATWSPTRVRFSPMWAPARTCLNLVGLKMLRLTSWRQTQGRGPLTRNLRSLRAILRALGWNNRLKKMAR